MRSELHDATLGRGEQLRRVAARGVVLRPLLDLGEFVVALVLDKELHRGRAPALMVDRPQEAEAARDLRRSGELESSVKDVLWQRWDPIGVNDVPEAYGEYDSYAGPIATLIRRGATEQELREHLEAITADRMGIKNAAAAAAAAASLARLTRS